MVFVYPITDRTEIWKCWFLRRGENWRTWRKTSWSKGENQQQTQPMYGVNNGIWTRATLVGGECSHYCAIPCSKYLVENLSLGFILITFLKFTDFSLNIFIKSILVIKKEYSLRASPFTSYFSTPSREFAKKYLYWKISFGLVIFRCDCT